MSLHPLTKAVLDDMARAMTAASDRMREKDARIAELEARLGAGMQTVVWRGSVSDLVTDIAALLTVEQLAEFAAQGHWVKFKERLTFAEINVLEACVELTDAQLRFFQNSGPFRHICKAEMKRRGIT